MRSAIAMGALCALLVLGCGDDAPPPAREKPAALDAEASAWVERVEQQHAIADVSDWLTAEQALLEALDLPVPKVVSAEHKRVVHQDLYFRLALRALARDLAEPALEAVTRGLALGGPPDLFRANLLIARGQAFEALERDSEAAASYYEALEINRALLHRVLAASDAGPP